MDSPESEKQVETNQKKEKKPMAKKGKEEFVFQIYNSLTQQKEVFKPKVPGKVGMYVCGVTAYDLSHLGHARAAVCFDVLYRYLDHLGYQVNYVRNFTDVDDKIIRRANESGEDPLALSKHFCQEYLVDVSNLQCRLPTHQPTVSRHMDQIKRMIKKIIDNGCGYVVDGDVFFSVDKFPDYGKLSGQKLENHRAGERVSVDSRKRNPADFALWKAAKPGEPSWESEWGWGRPGWHIECSAMSEHYLTYKFDIHGGGIDLIFPHHENEIAQSCAACPESNVTYWMHNGHVTNNNEKMSKSLGNFFTIREITERYHPLALRHFLISAAHYRSPLNYTIAQLENSSDIIFYTYQTLKDCEYALLAFQEAIANNLVEQKGKPAQASAEARVCINKLRSEFQAKMSDDLNASHVLTGTFTEALRFINSSLNKLKKQQPKQQLSTIRSLTDIEKEVMEVLGVMGLLPAHSYDEVLQQLKDMALLRAGLVEDDVQLLINERTEIRRAKTDFTRGDQIRADLAMKGIALMDIGSDTIWRPCDPFKQQKAPAQPPEQGQQKVPARPTEERQTKAVEEEEKPSSVSS